ncbi:MAG: TonB-dependent receptor, partial [Bacteroidetes bacterium]|nr:TonB-dependent receptor [Bacteroidota bacterium]
YFGEVSLFIPHQTSNTVVGINFTGDAFKKTIEYVPSLLQNFSNTTFGAFAQHTIHLQNSTTIDLGIRNDYHTTYGNKLLPRVALFHRFNQHWATRAGIGFGYKTPNVLAPQNIDYALNKITPIDNTVIAEKSIGYNAEINYKKVWSEETELFINCAFFLTRIKDPIIASQLSSGYVSFYNASKPLTTKGFDVYIQGKIDDVEVYLGYTYTSALRKYLSDNQFAPLTPKHRFATTIVKEFEPHWRIGIEASYNGKQHRYDGTLTSGYLFMAAMIERKFGNHLSVVLNGENLLDYRQSKVEAINIGTTANPNFQPLWAPIDGRVINVSVKYKW